MRTLPKPITPYDVFITDVNGDGKSDIIVSDYTVRKITVLRNIIGDPVSVIICPPLAGTGFQSDLTGNAYQWQVDTGGGFVNLTDDNHYNGSNSRTLQLTGVAPWIGYHYNCLANSRYNSLFILKAEMRWTSTMSAAWENPANWSCAAVLDSTTDVIIPSSSVTFSANTTVRSLKINTGATIRVAAGVVLQMHK